jgi:hypothetical protein
MKYYKKYGLFLNKTLIKKWKEDNPDKHISNLLEEYLCVTEHGTICRKDIKDTVEKANEKGKNKNYMAGLKLSPFIKTRALKKAARYKQILELSKLIEKEKANDRQICLYKKLRLLEKGRYNVRDLRKKRGK